MALPYPLNELSLGDIAVVQESMQTLDYPADSCIFKFGSEGDAAYILDTGIVRIEADDPSLARNSEIDSENILGYVEPGNIFGELCLLDRQPRSASAFAETDITVRRFTLDALHRLQETHPQIATSLYAAFGRQAATKLRQTNERLANAIFNQGPEKEQAEIDDMVARAQQAQTIFKDWPEDKVDALLSAIAHKIHASAEQLAQANVKETGIGNVASKILKNKATSLGLYEMFLAGNPGMGFTHIDKTRHVNEFADPVGVIFALGPITNPVSTFSCKSLITLKSRNAMILSPNRGAEKVTAMIGDLVREELRDAGAPVDLIQYVKAHNSRKKTMLFMQHPDVSLILATGGVSMVHSAYCSGTPAIGVGAGNAPALVCSDANIPEVVAKILQSKTFDNGLPCGAEHNLIVVKSIHDEFIQACVQQGVAVLTVDEISRFTDKVFNDTTKHIRPELIGHTAAFIAEHAGIERDYPIALVIVPSDSINYDNPYAHEKMAPVLSLFTADDEAQGIEMSYNLLNIDGHGHTANIHSDDETTINEFARRVPASRILVNSPSFQGSIGVTTGLMISSMLGCGSYGGTSTTDNIGFRHLMNVKRIAYFGNENVERWTQYLS